MSKWIARQNDNLLKSYKRQNILKSNRYIFPEAAYTEAVIDLAYIPIKGSNELIEVFVFMCA